MSGPWFVAIWRCFCSDAGTDQHEFPQTCPHHDVGWLTVAKVQIPGSVATGHACPEPDESFNSPESVQVIGDAA